MGISALNGQFNVATKSQYDSYATPSDTTANYPAYVEDEPKSSNSMLGLVALGVIAAAGIGYGVMQRGKIADLTKKVTEKSNALETAEAKLKEAEQKNTDAAKKAVEDASKETKKPGFFSRIKNANIWKGRLWPWNWFGKKA